MLNLQNLTALGFLTAFIAFFGQIKAQIIRFSQFFIRADTSNSYRSEFLSEVLKDSKIFRYGNLNLTTDYAFNIKTNNYSDFLFRLDNSLLVIYKKWVPLIIYPKDYCGFKVVYLYGTFDFQGILNRLIKNKNKTNTFDTNLFSVEEIYGEEPQPGTLTKTYQPSEGKGLVSDNPDCFKFRDLKEYSNVVGESLENLIQERPKFDAKYYWSEETNSLYKDIEFWKTSKKWFSDKNLPWKRSALLFGCPGGGKSRAVVEIAKRLGIYVKSFHLSTMNSKEFSEEFNKDCENGNIILIEDIDSIFNGRENICPKSLTKQALSFDDLINAISGVGSFRSKKYIVVTTNHPEKLDPALKRAGRLDLHIEFKDITEDGRNFIANNLLSDWPDKIEETKSWPKMPVCDFENKCIELAVTQYWKEKNERNIV